MPPGTTLRNIRVKDELWNDALALAERDGTTVSEVVRQLLQEWVDSK